MELTRTQLEEKYRQFACPVICPYALELIPDNVLRKTIAVSIYRSKFTYAGWERGRVFQIISEEVGLTNRALRNYFPVERNGCSAKVA